MDEQRDEVTAAVTGAHSPVSTHEASTRAGAGPDTEAATTSNGHDHGAPLAPIINTDQEDTLREAALFRATFERAPIGMAHALITGQFVRVNAAFCTMLGYTQSELLASTFQAVTHADDRTATTAYCERICGGAIPGATFEKRYVRKDGSIIWGNLSISVTFDAAGRPAYYLGVIEDISARKHAELALQAMAEREGAARATAELASARLQAVLDVLPLGVAIADDSGRLLVQNPAMRAIWSDAPRSEDTAGYQDYKAWWPQTGERLAGSDWTLARALRDGVVVTGEEVDIEAFDGQRKTILSSAAPIRDDRGVIVGGVEAALDITARRRLARVVTERADELGAILDTLTEGITVYNADGSIRLTNPAARRLFARAGMGAAKLDTTVLAERAPAYEVRDEQGAPLPRERWPVTRVLRGETLDGTATVETTVALAPDQELVVSYSGAPLRNERGELIGAVLAARDVTDRRQFEREREHMLGLVSHELKTPLTTLKALGQLAERRLVQGGHPEAEMVRRMTRAAESMNKLVNDLLDATRLDTGKMALMREPCDLRALCEQVAADQETTSGRAIALQLPDAPVVVDADESRLGQVLANLLSNALKYSPAARPVTLILRRQQATVHILVCDEGPGIPADALPRLFERFYRVPGIEVQQGIGVGLGLGLYICRRLVEMHDGQLRVESTPGKGATFEVILPLVQAERGQPH